MRGTGGADPPEVLIQQAVARVQQHPIDIVIGLGGGSPMDVAKLIAVLCSGQQTLSTMYGIGNIQSGRLPLIQIPTPPAPVQKSLRARSSPLALPPRSTLARKHVRKT